MSMSDSPASQTPEAPRTSPRPTVWTFATLFAGLALAAAIGAKYFVHARSRAPLPVLWTLPDWQLVDQQGRPFGARDLRGSVYIANFVFTSCVTECPRLSRRMSHLQPEAYAHPGRVRLVSISVDPERDTPERLREYLTHYRVDERVWTFVTGPEPAVTSLLLRGFRVAIERPSADAQRPFDPVRLAHSNRFALVDGRGRLRGTYLDDEVEGPRLHGDLAFLLREAPR